MHAFKLRVWHYMVILVTLDDFAILKYHFRRNTDFSHCEEDLERVGANHQNWHDYIEMKQWAQCMEMVSGKESNEKVLLNSIYFTRDPIDPMSGAKNIRDANKSVQFNKLHFYSYKNREVDEHGLPICRVVKNDLLVLIDFLQIFEFQISH